MFLGSSSESDVTILTEVWAQVPCCRQGVTGRRLSLRQTALFWDAHHEDVGLCWIEWYTIHLATRELSSAYVTMSGPLKRASHRILMGDVAPTGVEDYQALFAQLQLRPP